DVLISPFVRQDRPLERGAFFEPITDSLGTTNSKVRLELLEFVVFSLSEPAALFGRIGECGEHDFRRLRIAAFNDERAVNNGLLFHGFFLSSTLKLILQCLRS